MPQLSAFDEADLTGFLHRPDSDAARGLVLAHGAGGNCRTPLVVAAATAFCAAGMAVLRIDLPFRRRRPSGPPSPADAVRDRIGLAAAVAVLRSRIAGPVLLGGVSYGGRQASMLAAEQPPLAAGLLLLSYPLHPPGQPQRLRTAHFPQLAVPALFVQGTRDAFGSVAELQQAVAAIPAPTRIVRVENAGHDLNRGRFDLAAVAQLVLEM